MELNTEKHRVMSMITKIENDTWWVEVPGRNRRNLEWVL